MPHRHPAPQTNSHAYLETLEGNNGVALPSVPVRLCGFTPQRQGDLRARIVHQSKVALFQLLASPDDETRVGPGTVCVHTRQVRNKNATKNAARNATRIVPFDAISYIRNVSIVL